MGRDAAKAGVSIFEEHKVAKQEQHEQATDAPAAQGNAAISARGAARRRFAKAGMGASGVLLTLASQPGMAATVCTTPSGFLSGTWASHAPNNPCLGVSPGYWKNHHDEWKGSAGTDGTARFSFVFPTTLRTSALKAYTLFEVVDPTVVVNGSDPDNVAMHIVASLLNVRSGRISVMNEERVREIWREYASTGYFTPSAGAKKWNGYEITEYLKSTMTL